MEVYFESIFNPKRSNQIFNNNSSYQCPTTTLLVSEPKWSSVPVTDPIMGPSIWSIKSHSTYQSIKPLKNLSSDISWPSLVFNFMCLAQWWFGFSLLWPCLNTEHLVLLGTPGRLQFRNMTALGDNGVLVVSRLILLAACT